uniref:Clathrin light chain n=1 Tax=Syphacia muris TaxID=451379 RepID=A0A0N5A8I8_9BILA
MSDPVADFLAHEQDVLAGIEGAPVGFEGGDDDAVPPAPVGEEGANANDGLVLNGVDSGVDLQGLDQQQQPVPAQQSTVENSTPPSVLAQQPVQPKIEPEKIRKWREEQKKMLEEKDKEEERKKEELREAASKELEQWFANRKERIAQTKIANRKAEAEFIADRDKGEGGADWERIAKLCDFNAKNSKNVTDLSRLRSLLLQLKGTTVSSD